MYVRSPTSRVGLEVYGGFAGGFGCWGRGVREAEGGKDFDFHNQD